MRNPWLSRNPWMSLWMSGANTVFHTWRAHAVNAASRTLRAQVNATAPRAAADGAALGRCADVDRLMLSSIG